MSKQIFFHAGAHRTGTSSFQLCLYENRDRLNTGGYDLAYPGRDGVPEGRLALRLPAPRHKEWKDKFTGSVRNTLLNSSPDPDRALVISEENLPGRMLHFQKGLFFPAAGKRFRTFRKGIGDAELDLIYVVRSYDELFVSAYRKRAEDNAVPAFDTLLTNLMGMDRGWPELIAEMRETMALRRLVVVPYARRGTSASLLARLLPDVPEGDLVEPQTTLNLSATDAGLIALQKRYHGGETLPREDWQEVVRSYADDREDKGFAQFPPEAQETLRARYERDLERLAEMPGIEFV